MKILRRPEVEAKTTLSGPTIWRHIQAGTFPPQVQLGPNSVGWIEEEIDAWIASRQRGPIPFETLNAPKRETSRKPTKAA